MKPLNHRIEKQKLTRCQNNVMLLLLVTTCKQKDVILLISKSSYSDLPKTQTTLLSFKHMYVEYMLKKEQESERFIHHINVFIKS